MEYINKFDRWLETLSFTQSFGVIIAILATLVAITLFLLWLFSPKPHGDEYSVMATVEEKAYAPSRISSGTGIGVTSGGQVGTVATSSSSPQSFNVVFITENKKVFVANDKEAYSQLSVGQKVKIWLQPYRYFGKEKEPEYRSFEVV